MALIALVIYETVASLLRLRLFGGFRDWKIQAMAFIAAMVS
ncbi:MAG TPA: hypothetical protein VN496_10890 [Burkholderiales bacterium]|nr:hypothetical protein [Burkholderiales bacterium]